MVIKWPDSIQCFVPVLTPPLYLIMTPDTLDCGQIERVQALQLP